MPLRNIGSGTNLPRQSDITKILFARYQEDDYDTDVLYALFSALSQEQVTELYRAIRENNWHLMPEENREAFLRQLFQ